MTPEARERVDWTMVSVDTFGSAGGTPGAARS